METARPQSSWLEVDRSTVFTFPDTTENRLGFVQGRFNVVASPTWSIQVTGYYRDLDRDTLNGDEAEFGICDEDSLPPDAPENTLCLGVDDNDDEEDEALADGSRAALQEASEDTAANEEEGAESPLVDARTSQFITEDDAEGNGAFNRTTTRAKGYGVTFQATAANELAGRDNVLTLGVSADLADVAFTSNSEVGTLTPDRTVAGSGLLTGIFGEAPDDQFNTSLNTDSRAFGFYFNDTLSVTERTHVTFSGRFNQVRIEILDNLGTALSGDHEFSRVNVSVGAVHELGERASVSDGIANQTVHQRRQSSAVRIRTSRAACRTPSSRTRLSNKRSRDRSKAGSAETCWLDHAAASTGPWRSTERLSPMTSSLRRPLSSSGPASSKTPETPAVSA